MPIDPARIGFSPVGEGHYPLLHAWLNRPHMREWWGDPEEELGFIRDMVEGKDTTRPFLIMLDGKPVGYIQYWFLGHHQNEAWTKDNPWLLELPQEAVGVDLSIGEVDRLSTGIGSAALIAFVARLRGLGHETIIIDPDPANARAVRAYEKAGFRPVEKLLGRTGDDVLIMQFDPKANETS
ncbi:MULTISPECIES: GNAT family N-acetyltransferase [unclassified Shinella]|uniref:GNAT family N-acetyltransferase n=1 Tax=unclassified Shinella TaxID=2643062 RepID=UPI00225D84C2|nr:MULTISPECIES: GNAT family N-acetyltransferase [unclassified Shinella]MCO5141050.1 acetyltransferase [Shinella sp.]MDC7257313.1 acetyltransferase [Shinella sp. YE25]CAI0340189.1 GCN5 family acetyltransferase [Rhizobiaceae bacterium]CAK7258573.1 aminoglycoside 6'-N-acetyltransferase [Shinella sp. WSC3-e]